MDEFLRRFLTYFVFFALPVAVIAFAAVTTYGGIIAIIAGMVWIGVGVVFVTPPN